MKIEDAKRIFESTMGGVVNEIESITSSRNFIFIIQSNDQKYILKIYNTSSRGFYELEDWAYTILENFNGLKKKFFSGKDEQTQLSFIITEYIEGKSLNNILNEKKLNNTETHYIGLQIVTFVKCILNIKMNKFGRLINPSEGIQGTHKTWSLSLFDYLANLEQRISNLSDSHQVFLNSILNELMDFFKQNKSYLNQINSTLIPVDLNLSNFLIDDEKLKVFALDLESLWAGDPLLAFGDWMGNTYNTPLYSAFSEHWGKLTEIETNMIRAYAILSNLSALVYIAEKNTDNLNTATPWGSPHKYIDLINEHRNFLKSKKKISNKSSAFFIHTSIRTIPLIKSNLLNFETLHERISEITNLVRRFSNIEFGRGNESFYAIIYGSYSYKLAQPSSDLDILFVSDKVDAGRIQRVITFINSLHEQFGLRCDNEIPYECKVIKSYEFIDKACSGEGIRNKGQWEIPKILKTKEYLTSDALLLRFFMGMLVNPNIFVDGNYKIYEGHRISATKNLIKAICSINQLKKVTSHLLVKNFCISNQNETGDYYMGFTNKEPFKSYLLEHLEKTLNSMINPVDFGLNGAIYNFSPDFLKMPEKPGEIHKNKIEDLIPKRRNSF